MTLNIKTLDKENLIIIVKLSWWDQQELYIYVTQKLQHTTGLVFLFFSSNQYNKQVGNNGYGELLRGIFQTCPSGFITCHCKATGHLFAFNHECAHTNTHRHTLMVEIMLGPHHWTNTVCCSFRLVLLQRTAVFGFPLSRHFSPSSSHQFFAQTLPFTRSCLVNSVLTHEQLFLPSS